MRLCIRNVERKLLTVELQFTSKFVVNDITVKRNFLLKCRICWSIITLRVKWVSSVWIREQDGKYFYAKFNFLLDLTRSVESSADHVLVKYFSTRFSSEYSTKGGNVESRKFDVARDIEATQIHGIFTEINFIYISARSEIDRWGAIDSIINTVWYNLNRHNYTKPRISRIYYT